MFVFENTFFQEVIRITTVQCKGRYRLTKMNENERLQCDRVGERFELSSMERFCSENSHNNDVTI